MKHSNLRRAAVRALALAIWLLSVGSISSHVAASVIESCEFVVSPDSMESKGYTNVHKTGDYQITVKAATGYRITEAKLGTPWEARVMTATLQGPPSPKFMLSVAQPKAGLSVKFTGKLVPEGGTGPGTAPELNFEGNVVQVRLRFDVNGDNDFSQLDDSDPDDASLPGYLLPDASDTTLSVEVHLQGKPPAGRRIWFTPSSSNLLIKDPGGAIIQSIDAFDGVRYLNVQLADGSQNEPIDVSQPLTGEMTVLAELKDSGLVQTADKAKLTAFKVVIAKADGTPITEKQTTIVGKKIALVGKIIPANLNVTKQEWTIAGTAIKNYTQTVDKGERIDLAAEDKAKVDIAFYWIEGGDGRDVTYAATINNEIYTGQATFDVKRPTAIFKGTSTTNAKPVNVGNDGFEPGLTLHFGTNLDPGITWDAEVTAPANGKGQVAITQTVAILRLVTYDETPERRTGWVAGVPVLDDPLGIQYGGPVPIDANEAISLERNDSPAVPLVPQYKKRSVTDAFETFLMYRPEGADSIWVTLRTLSWDWSGSATKANANWSLDVGSNFAKDPISENSIALPQWKDFFRNVKEKPIQ